MSLSYLPWAGSAICAVLIVCLAVINLIASRKLDQHTVTMMPDPKTDPFNSEYWFGRAWRLEMIRRQCSSFIVLALFCLIVFLLSAALQGVVDLPMGTLICIFLGVVAVISGMATVIGSVHNWRGAWMFWKIK